MTTLAVLCTAVNPERGTDAFAYLTIWDDNTLLWVHSLPEIGWAYDNATVINVSSDGRYVCLSRAYTDSNTRVYSVSDGTYETVPELRNAEISGPFRNVIKWSPRNAFVSAYADFAYFPDAKELIALPGPSAQAKAGGAGFNVLAGLGLIFEGMEYDPYRNVMDYPIVARDLFTGVRVEPPARVNNSPFAGRRPVCWHDDTGIKGMIYSSVAYDSEINPLTRVISSLNWEKTLPVDMRPGNYFQNGCFFTKTGSTWPEPTWDDRGVIVTDEGDLNYLSGDVSGFKTTLNRETRILFEYNNFGFMWDDDIRVGVEPAPQGLSLTGVDLPPGAPPQFMVDLAPWGDFDFISAEITQVASPTLYRAPFQLEGEFWSQLRYSKETRLK